MRPNLLSFLGGVAFASGAFFLSGMQAGGPSNRTEGAISGDVREFLSHVTMVDMDDGAGGTARTVRISGLNLQVVNGLGSTESTNGVGNLVVGYGVVGTKGPQTGSHNIVGGQFNSYTSFGGLVIGEDNSIEAPFATVTGGQENAATGAASSVTGGFYCFARGWDSWVGGGAHNSAWGVNSSVCGGMGNQAFGDYSVVGGGASRQAPGSMDWAAGSLWEEQ